jgi:hypothetical protein
VYLWIYSFDMLLLHVMKVSVLYFVIDTHKFTTTLILVVYKPVTASGESW